MLFKKKASKKLFKYIGIVGHPRRQKALETHKEIYNWLRKQKYQVILEKQIAEHLNLKNIRKGELKEIGKIADLVIVIGGDGNMLSAARILSSYENKVIGINRGNLGFLTDLGPDNALQQLTKVLSGQFYEEQRFLLEIRINTKKNNSKLNIAINEVILHTGKVARMIEFEVYIDNRFAFFQRSDGLIITTPTGSTAYSLSAGGPILTPNLEAITLVPMFPHTLSSRPLVISSNSSIKLKFKQKNINYEISCDSQIILPIKHDDEILIKKSTKKLNLVHPKDYNYFNILSSKLGWSQKSF
ncbi:putative inorganic polyphosphate/ATP-NAD kinase [Candidatus Arsenophonus lipoptenae]|uniref:NAD kinase n=1 Tax=Candidatus Arsenophonus lipoptenae TaxID=634113 RepID=A0A0X9WAY6_9GAMM|nr:NAD(+) kinase [Candidatus Arsenophonus lipoptenae]AMA65048.1 putative inorganic polyphosphate/ATP-NAD kinase [Candidatus Arsenophonus lipoptenae]